MSVYDDVLYYSRLQHAKYGSVPQEATTTAGGAGYNQGVTTKPGP